MPAMILISGHVGPAARTADEEFLSLVYSDSEFIRAEFDAIIAAGWPDPPPAPPVPRGVAGPPVGSSAPSTLAYATRHDAPPTMPGVSRQVRQRSPPPASGSDDDTKGR